MEVIALYHLQKMFPFRYFLICVLDSYFIHRYIIIKYDQVRFRVKSANYYESYGHFLQNACVWVRMALGGGISIGDNLHEMSNPVFWEKLEKYFKMMSAENFSQCAKC